MTAGAAFGQKRLDWRTIQNFQTTKEDSLFISKYSELPYQIQTKDYLLNTDTTGNSLFRDLLSGKVGEVYGPYITDSSLYYIKILDADTSYRCRVGNIWIDINKGREAAVEQANRILAEVNQGKDYNLYCGMYSDDKNKKNDCDLGWVYNKIMVEPFATEITKHKKGDVYLVETIYGFHVVKSLADPYKARQVVKYVCLSIKK
jgi:parvulin-like peptidyl-prolyl isomerase